MALSLLYTPSTYAVLAGVLGVLYALYRAALPKPIPGIPYHKASANNVLGDIPQMVRFRRGTGSGPRTVVDWFALQGKELNAPVYQIFLAPFGFGKPTVCITDPREAQDILLRRSKEFDRSKFFKSAFSGSIPNHHIVQDTNDKFRAGRRLVADTMTTPFLNAVSRTTPSMYELFFTKTSLTTTKVAAPHLHKHSKYLMDLWRVKNRVAKGHAFAVAKDINHMALDSSKSPRWQVVRNKLTHYSLGGCIRK